MRPLRVALITRAGSVPGRRNVGAWSYAVPEFTVCHIPVTKNFCLSREDLSREHDVIVYEDGKVWGTIVGRSRIPVVYVVTDSTLSEEHYRRRLQQAKQCDLILVDWDQLSRFVAMGKPVRRWSYCVNDLLFRDWGEEKVVDVAFHAGTKGAPERAQLLAHLGRFCADRGYRFEGGIREGTAYALGFNRAKIVVDLARNRATRNHRTFDAMASMTCLLTSPVPEVSGEDHGIAGVHYETWSDYGELEAKIERLLAGNRWWQIADAAYHLVHEKHTWRLRAAELRRILVEAFPKLEGVA